MKTDFANAKKVQTTIAGTVLYMALEVLRQWDDDEKNKVSFNPYKQMFFLSD